MAKAAGIIAVHAQLEKEGASGQRMKMLTDRWHELVTAALRCYNSAQDSDRIADAFLRKAG